MFCCTCYNGTYRFWEPVSCCSGYMKHNTTRNVGQLQQFLPRMYKDIPEQTKCAQMVTICYHHQCKLYLIPAAVFIKACYKGTHTCFSVTHSIASSFAIVVLLREACSARGTCAAGSCCSIFMPSYPAANLTTYISLVVSLDTLLGIEILLKATFQKLQRSSYLRF